MTHSLYDKTNHRTPRITKHCDIAHSEKWKPTASELFCGGILISKNTNGLQLLRSLLVFTLLAVAT